MPITINGSGTLTGINAGGLPDDCITTADIAAGAVTTAKITGGPAFSAFGASQSLGQNVQTKLTLGTESVDTANCYDPTTSRFTPNVAGYYLILGQCQYTGATSGGSLFVLLLAKNGASLEVGVNAATAFYRQTVQHIYYMNGTTDYLEFYANHNAPGTQTVNSAWFQGFLARPA